jgi:hypothetical protein
MCTKAAASHTKALWPVMDLPTMRSASGGFPRRSRGLLREEPGGVVVEEDAVAAEEFAAEGDGFAHPGRDVLLGRRGVLVVEDAVVLQPGELYQPVPGGGDVAQAPSRESRPRAVRKLSSIRTV